MALDGLAFSLGRSLRTSGTRGFLFGLLVDDWPALSEPGPLEAGCAVAWTPGLLLALLDDFEGYCNNFLSLC